MADENQKPDDALDGHPDTEALLKVVDEVLAAEDDRAFEAREAALLVDFIKARNEVIKVLARGAELVRLRDGKLSRQSRQQHELMAGEIRELIDLLQGRTHA